MDREDIHPAILDAITELLQQPRGRRTRLDIDFSFYFDNGEIAHGSNRQSVEYLVDFLQGDSHEVTELSLAYFSPSEPADSGLDILREFFANNTTLTTVMLRDSDFGSEEDASRILAAFEANTSVTELSIYNIEHLADDACGRCIAGLLQNNHHLQRLHILGFALRNAGIRVILPALQTNRCLKDLNLWNCELGDEEFRLIADALFGNTQLDILDVGSNQVSSNGLDHITRLLEFSQLKHIGITHCGESVFNDEDTVRRFTRVLSRHNFLTKLDLSTHDLRGPVLAMILQAFERTARLEELHLCYGQGDLHHLIEILPRMKGLKRLSVGDLFVLDSAGTTGLYRCLASDDFASALDQNTYLEEIQGPEHSRNPDLEGFINPILARNRKLNRARALLTLQPRTGLPIASKSGIWCMAMARLSAPDTSGGSGASAVFHILQTRPALLEQQLRRRQRSSVGSGPSHAAAAAVNNSNDSSSSPTRSGDAGRKRPRLSDL